MARCGGGILVACITEKFILDNMRMKDVLRGCEKYFYQIQRLLICFEEGTSIKRKHRWTVVGFMRDLLTRLHHQCSKYLLKELLWSKREMLLSVLVHFLKLIVISSRKLKNVRMVESTIKKDLKLIYNILGSKDKALILVALKAGEIITEGQGLLYICQAQVFGLIVREVLSSYSVGINCMNEEVLWCSILLSRLWLLSCEREARCKALLEIRALLPVAVEVILPDADSSRVRSMSIKSLLKFDMTALVKIAPKTLQSMETLDILHSVDNDEQPPAIDTQDPSVQLNLKSVTSIVKMAVLQLKCVIAASQTGINKCQKLEELPCIQEPSEHSLLESPSPYPSQDVYPSCHYPPIPSPLQMPSTCVDQNVKVLEGSSRLDVSVGGKRAKKENKTCAASTSCNFDVFGGDKRVEKENKANYRSSINEKLVELQDFETDTVLTSYKDNSQKIDLSVCSQRSSRTKFSNVDAIARAAGPREATLKVSEDSPETPVRPKKVKMMPETEFEISWKSIDSLEDSYVYSNDKCNVKRRSCKVRKSKQSTEMNIRKRKKREIPSQLDQEDEMGHTEKNFQVCPEENIVEDDLVSETIIGHDEIIVDREENVYGNIEEEKSKKLNGAKDYKSAIENNKVAGDQSVFPKTGVNDIYKTFMKDIGTNSNVAQEDCESKGNIDYQDSAVVMHRTECIRKLDISGNADATRESDIPDVRTEIRSRCKSKDVLHPRKKGLERRNVNQLQSLKNHLNYNENHTEGKEIDGILISTGDAEMHVVSKDSFDKKVIADSESKNNDDVFMALTYVGNAHNLSVSQSHENERDCLAQDILDSQKVVVTPEQIQNGCGRSSGELFIDPDENFSLILESDVGSPSSHVEKTSKTSSQDVKTPRKLDKIAATNSSANCQSNSFGYLQDTAASKIPETNSSYLFNVSALKKQFFDEPRFSELVTEPLRCEGHSLEKNFSSVRKSLDKLNFGNFDMQDEIHSQMCDRDSGDYEIRHGENSSKEEIDKDLEIRDDESLSKEERNTEKGMSAEEPRSNKDGVRSEKKRLKKQDNAQTNRRQRTIKKNKEVAYLSSPEKRGNASKKIEVQASKKNVQLEPKMSAINRTTQESLGHGSLPRNLRGVEIRDSHHVPEGWQRVIKPRLAKSTRGLGVRTDVKVLLPDGKMHHYQKSLKKYLQTKHFNLKDKLDMQKMFRMSPSTRAKVMLENEHLTRAITAERERGEVFGNPSSKTYTPLKLTFKKTAAKPVRGQPHSKNDFIKGDVQQRKNGMRDLKKELLIKPHAYNCNKVAGRDGRKLHVEVRSPVKYTRHKKEADINPRASKHEVVNSSSDFTANKSFEKDLYELSEDSIMDFDTKPLRLKVHNKNATKELDICKKDGNNESKSHGNELSDDTAAPSPEYPQEMISGPERHSCISEVQKSIEMIKDTCPKEGNFRSFRLASAVHESCDGDSIDDIASHKKSGQSHSVPQGSTDLRSGIVFDTVDPFKGVQFSCCYKVDTVKLPSGLYSFRVPCSLRVKPGDVLYASFKDTGHETSDIVASDSQDVSEKRSALSGTAACDNVHNTGANKGDFVVNLQPYKRGESQDLARINLHGNEIKNNKCSGTSKQDCGNCISQDIFSQINSDNMFSHSNADHIQKYDEISCNTHTSHQKVPVDIHHLEVCSEQVKGEVNTHTSNFNALFGSNREKCQLEDLITPQNKTIRASPSNSPRNQKTQILEIPDCEKVPVLRDEESGDRIALIPIPNTVTGENVVLELRCYQILPHSSYLIDSKKFSLSHELVSPTVSESTMLLRQLYFEESEHIKRKHKSKIVGKQSKNSSNDIGNGKPSCRKRLLEYFISEMNSAGLGERKMNSLNDASASGEYLETHDTHVTREFEVMHKVESLNARTSDGSGKFCCGDVYGKNVSPVKPHSHDDQHPDGNLSQVDSDKAAFNRKEIGNDIDMVETASSTSQSQTSEDNSESHCLDFPVRKKQSSVIDRESTCLVLQTGSTQKLHGGLVRSDDLLTLCFGDQLCCLRAILGQYHKNDEGDSPVYHSRTSSLCQYHENKKRNPSALLSLSLLKISCPLCRLTFYDLKPCSYYPDLSLWNKNKHSFGPDSYLGVLAEKLEMEHWKYKGVVSTLFPSKSSLALPSPFQSDPLCTVHGVSDELDIETLLSSQISQNSINPSASWRCTSSEKLSAYNVDALPSCSGQAPLKELQLLEKTLPSSRDETFLQHESLQSPEFPLFCGSPNKRKRQQFKNSSKARKLTWKVSDLHTRDDSAVLEAQELRKVRKRDEGACSRKYHKLNFFMKKWIRRKCREQRKSIKQRSCKP